MTDAAQNMTSKPGSTLTSRQQHDPVDSKQQCCTLSNETIRPPKPGSTLQTLKAAHPEFTKAWKASTTHKELETFFNQVFLKQQNLKITSCVCLSLGSLTAEPRRRRSPEEDNALLAQLVAFESWIEILGTKHTIDNVYFQDPAFNALDVEFLQLKGYTVIEVPASDEYISESTFLFGPGCPYTVIMHTIGITHPPLIISGDMQWYCTKRAYDEENNKITAEKDGWDKRHQVPPPALERAIILPFLNRRVRLPMPDFEYIWTYTHVIYYRPDNDSDLVPVEIKTSDWEAHLDYLKAKGEDRPSS